MDKLEITLDGALLDLMKDHLENGLDNVGDTSFDRWFHGQLYLAEFNKV